MIPAPHRVLIVGAGPAGIALRMWLHNLAVPTHWVCADSCVGGTLQRVGNPIHVYPGVPAEHGPDLIRAFTAHLTSLGLFPAYGLEVTALLQDGDRFWVHTSGGRDAAEIGTEPFQVVALATGTRPRRLGLPHEEELLGRGVEVSVTRRRVSYQGQEVAVVGGGDAACEGALLLAPLARHVHLIHRTGKLRAQRRFVDALADCPNVTLHWNRSVTALLVDCNAQELQGVSLTGGETIPCTGLFVRIGVEGRMPTISPDIARAADGTPRCSADGSTAVPGIYLCGDVRGEAHQSVLAAMGHASQSAQAIQRYLGLR